MAEDPIKRTSIAADVFAGAGIGLLLGTVLGLSTTPVVALVVGALSSLLAVFLGLDGKQTTSRLPAVNAIRIGAFGFATVAGLALGLHVRINNPLASDPSRAMARWSEAFPDNPTLARQMMVHERTAITPWRLTYDETADNDAPVRLDTGAAGAKQAVLFSSLSDYDACSRLDPERFATADETLSAYSRGDPPDLVRAVGDQIGALPGDERGLAVQLAHEILCQIQIEEEK